MRSRYAAGSPTKKGPRPSRNPFYFTGAPGEIVSSPSGYLPGKKNINLFYCPPRLRRGGPRTTPFGSSNLPTTVTEKHRGRERSAPCVLSMARPERFELPTLWFVARCSVQLSYGRICFQLSVQPSRKGRQSLQILTSRALQSSKYPRRTALSGAAGGRAVKRPLAPRGLSPVRSDMRGDRASFRPRLSGPVARSPRRGSHGLAGRDAVPA